jgi:hypothetical protein
VVAQLNPILYLVWLLSISLESIAFAISVVRPNKHVVFRCYLGFCIARSVLSVLGELRTPMDVLVRILGRYNHRGDAGSPGGC